MCLVLLLKKEILKKYDEVIHYVGEVPRNLFKQTTVKYLFFRYIYYLVLYIFTYTIIVVHNKVSLVQLLV